MATFTIRGTLRGEDYDGSMAEVPVEASFTRDDADGNGLPGLIEALMDHEAAMFVDDPALMADSVLIVSGAAHERAFDLIRLPSAADYMTARWPQ